MSEILYLLEMMNGADGISDIEHVAIEGMELLGEG
jgi:hypothetical protein